MRVLVVDDSRVTQRIMMRLVRDAGIDETQIQSVSSGAEALAAIQSTCPDLVITDMNMPNMTGVELLRQIKAANPNVNVGIVTSLCDDATAREANEAGACFLLNKPCSSTELAEALAPLRADDEATAPTCEPTKPS